MNGSSPNLNGADINLLSSESDNAIPDEDGLDVDEELRFFRAKRRNKRNPNPRRKKDCDSDDSTDVLDVDAVRGVDLPGRRKSKKVRYDNECEIAIFELGMIFESAKEFRIALAKYAIEYKVQIKLRPNEAHRGFHAAVNEVLPNAKVRRCARHIWSN
ncbi:hypothetical protein HAX54_028813 [Datura stramonium]|uniref:Transposase MuDR plant domain-containing protein n=1 Tax=Datura stramonium TaxID=4076 RepID=A0ABS8V7I3_DATST|nr:hypothetical protein [Datura stramonium]